MSNFQIIREISSFLGVSGPESDYDIYSIDFLNSIKRAVKRIYSELTDAKKRILELENSDAFTQYKTNPAESLAGIAIRQLKNEDLWIEIARLNSLKFPDMHSSNYYPVGTILILPKLK
jgi:hypothetical protein